MDDDGTCLDFVDFRKKPEYQTEYYIAVEACDGKIGRARRLGRKISINGEDFFTKYSPCSDEEHTYITHGRTGCYCGTVKHIKGRFKEFMRRQIEMPYVMNLPLVEFDETKREYVYVKEDVERSV